MPHPDLDYISKMIDQVWALQRFGVGEVDENVAKLNDAVVPFLRSLNEYKKYCEGC